MSPICTCSSLVLSDLLGIGSCYSIFESRGVVAVLCLERHSTYPCTLVKTNIYKKFTDVIFLQSLFVNTQDLMHGDGEVEGDPPPSVRQLTAVRRLYASR